MTRGKRNPGEKTDLLAGQKTDPLDPSQEVQLKPSLGHLPEDTVIANRYKVVEEISTQGGEADVFRCQDLHDHKEVAVKIYRAHLKPKKELQEVMLNLSHDNIVKLLNFDLWNGRFFEVMEYIEGGTLADHMPLREEHIISIIIPQVLAGINHLHNHNIIHRDLKPTNLFFNDHSRHKVLVGDYGISSLFKEQGSLHQSSSVKRTVEFAAPELFTGVFGYQVDYYAFGITLLYLLTGRSPFEGMNEMMIMHTHYLYEENIFPPKDSSDRIKDLVRGLLHKDYKKRWGCDEVKRWFKGEAVPVAPYHDRNQHQRATFSYRLSEDLVAKSPQELGEMMLNHSHLALKHIKRPHFFEAFHRYQDLAAKLYDIREKKHPSELGLLMGIAYTLNPDMPYKLIDGFEARTPEELARKIDYNQRTWQAGKGQLYNGSIPAWLRAIGYEDIADAWEEEGDKYNRG
ncbi:MAG: serine/threonine-protein kinase [Kosmotogaceae bacterium]